MSLLNELLVFIDMNKPKQGNEDTWNWKHTTNDIHSAGKAYRILHKKHEQDEGNQQDVHIFKKIWRNYAPRRNQTTFWKVLRERMMIKDNLVKMGVPLSNDDLKCILCGEGEENAFHLFFNCKFASNRLKRTGGRG